MSSSNASSDDDNDSDPNYNFSYPRRPRSPSIEIDWPPVPKGCGLCPSREFRTEEACQQHKTQKIHRECDQCRQPLELGQAYYCASTEDGIARDKYFQGVPNRHLGCKPVHREWGKQIMYAAEVEGLMPAALLVINGSLTSGVMDAQEGRSVAFAGIAAGVDTTVHASNALTCWVCQQICVSQLALQGHCERTGHGLCPYYNDKRRREEADDEDTGVLDSWGWTRRKRKRNPRSPSPIRQRPPRDSHENRHSTPHSCPNEILYFDSWFHLEEHLRSEHQNSSPKLSIPDNWTRPCLPSQAWAKQLATAKSVAALRRRGNSYSPEAPIKLLKDLRQLCYAAGEPHKTVYPFLHRFWNPSLIDQGFDPAPPYNKKRPPPRQFFFTPHPPPVIRKAVVLSTLTVGMDSDRDRRDRDRPVQATLIDFFTGETLISSLIAQKVDCVAHWREEETGLNAKLLQRAIWNTQILRGSVDARERMWDYINQDTIIVGHGLDRDLRALKMAHALVVDLKLVMADWLGIDEVHKGSPGHDGSTSPASEKLQLGKLTKSLLGLRIRGANKGKKQFRDTLEEVLAIREATMWCMENKELVKNWGVAMKHGYSISVQRE